MGLFTDRRPAMHVGQAPRWPDDSHGRPRVLIEHPDDLIRDVLTRQLGARGYDVLGCQGPGPDPDGHRTACPILHQEHCPAVDGADILITGLELSNSVNRVLLRRARTQHPELPVIVDSPRFDSRQAGASLGDRVLHHTTVDRVVETIEELVAG